MQKSNKNIKLFRYFSSKKVDIQVFADKSAITDKSVPYVPAVPYKPTLTDKSVGAKFYPPEFTYEYKYEYTYKYKYSYKKTEKRG